MICLAMHGILTGRTDVTWPESFQIYTHRHAPDVRVICDQYDAGPFPRLNWFRGNPRMAKAMALRLAAWLDDSHHEGLAMVAHSNGCDIVRRVALELGKLGVRVEAIVMVAPPVSSSLDKQGLQSLIDRKLLGRVVCYYTPRDTVLARRLSWNPISWVSAALRWPYGNAGRVGLKGCPTIFENGEAPAAPAFNRIFPKYWHTTYFNATNSRATFELMARDLHLTT